MGLLRRTPRPPADETADAVADDKVVELACLPLWQAQLVLHHLWEADVPTTLSEGGAPPWRFGGRDQMARLWVMEHRLAAARLALAEVVDIA